jgi:arylsulfatase A-like enzyme
MKKTLQAILVFASAIGVIACAQAEANKPNIDRIAEEGMAFTDYYGEQSCTAGRSSFIMGQSVFRTGLSKVGLPGAELGMREEEPTIAGLLKAQGYVQSSAHP